MHAVSQGSILCKLWTIGKQLPTLPHKVRGLNCQPQRWELSGIPLCHHGPFVCVWSLCCSSVVIVH